MKKIRNTILSVLAAAVLACCATPTLAGLYSPEAEAISVIDWSSFHLGYTGSSYKVSGAYFEAGAEMTDQDYYTNPTDAYYDSSTGYAWGETEITTPSAPYQDLYAAAGSFGPAAYEFGYADSGYYGQFHALSAGTLTISIEYFLYVFTETGMGEEAYADANVELYIGEESVYDFLVYWAADEDSYEFETDWRIAEITIDLAEGDILEFGMTTGAYASAASPVPLPGAAVFLVSGILAMASVQRKKHA